jgi:hypothetical protein
VTFAAQRAGEDGAVFPRSSHHFFSRQKKARTWRDSMIKLCVPRMEAFMKYTTILLIAALLGGCSSYSERGTGEGAREFNNKGYTVRCDATPANQQGCYTPAPSWSWWPSNHIKLKLGAN